MTERLSQVASAHKKIEKVLVTFTDGTTKEIADECIVLAYGNTEKQGREFRTQAETIMSANIVFAKALHSSIGTHLDSWEEQKLLNSVRKEAPEVADFLEKLFKAGGR